jgi:exodeoxyribonuclease VII small subunit
MNFEKSLNRLAEISGAMNDSNLPLEESLKLYEEAVRLANACKREIEAAKLTIVTIESAEITENETRT